MEVSQIQQHILQEMWSLLEQKETLREELKKIEVTLEQLITYAAKKNLKNIIPPAAQEATSLRKKKGVNSFYFGTSTITKAPIDKTPIATFPSMHERGAKKRAARGAIKTQILAALSQAGEKGMKVPALSQKTGIKSANLHVWFSNVGKKLPEIEHIGPGLYRLKS